MTTFMTACPCCKRSLEARIRTAAPSMVLVAEPEVVELEPLTVYLVGLFLYDGKEHAGSFATIKAIEAKVGCSLQEAKAVFDNRKRA